MISAAAQALLTRLQTRGIKLGLDKVRSLLDRVGAPDARHVQVAGTNGKGSVVHGLEAIALAGGVRTGTFTSPHLVSPTERVRVDGRPLDETEFGDRALRLGRRLEAWARQRSDLGDVTYFEFMLGLALDAFADHDVDLVLLEVGMGGRLDATTAAPAQLSCITSIALDHEAWLGPDLASIAAQKAGIVRPETPLVLGPLPDSARAVIAAAASAARAPVVHVREQEGVHNGMWGAHQRVNAAISWTLAAQLGLPTDDRARQALARSRVPGRCERVSEAPEVLLDGCHNPAGSEALAVVLGRRPAAGRSSLVVAVGRDKDCRGILAPLMPLVDEIHVTTYRDGRGATEATEVARVARELGGDPVLHATAADAVDAALARAGATDRVIVAGSLFLAGEVRAHLCPGIPT